MSIFDIILLFIIVCFGMAGLWFGLVHTVVSLFGSGVAIYLGTRYYAPVAEWLINTTGWNPNFSRVIIFIITFILINRLVVLVFWLINRFLKIFTNLPVIRLADRLLGLGFGLLEGALILTTFLYFVVRYPIGQSFMGWISASHVVPYLSWLSAVITPLIPHALSVLRSTIGGLL